MKTNMPTQDCKMELWKIKEQWGYNSDLLGGKIEDFISDLLQQEKKDLIDKLEYRKSKWPNPKDKQTKGYLDGLQTAIDLLLAK